MQNSQEGVRFIDPSSRNLAPLLTQVFRISLADFIWMYQALIVALLTIIKKNKTPPQRAQTPIILLQSLAPLVSGLDSESSSGFNHDSSTACYVFFPKVTDIAPSFPSIPWIQV